MTEVNAKGRQILTGPRGGKYVIGPSGKKIPIKSKAAPKEDPVAKPVSKVAKSPMVETGKVNAKKRPVFKDSKGRTYVKPDGKKVYVKKLFTPVKTEDKPPAKPPVAKTKEINRNEAARKVAKIWKQKVNARLKPMRKGKNYDPNVFQMVAPRLNLKVNNTTGKYNKFYSEFLFPIQTAKGARVNSKAVVAPKPENFRHVGYLASQVEYLQKLSVHDFMTVAAYTHYSHWWLGPFQRSGKVHIDFSSFRNDMIFPLFPQMELIIDSGYNVLKPNKVKEYQGYIDLFNQEKETVSKYFIYINLARTGVFSKEALELALKMYVNDLTRIINSSPPVVEPLTVYRGTSDDVLKEKKGNVYKSNQFTSTAYMVSQAAKYAGTGGGKYPHLQRITIPSGKHALFIAPVNKFGSYGEYEIVLPPCDFEILGRGKKTKVFIDGKFKNYRVTDLKVI